jgi:hypothetical protein
MTGYLTSHTMVSNYEKWNRKFRLSSFTAYQAQNILDISHEKEAQSLQHYQHTEYVGQ